MGRRPRFQSPTGMHDILPEEQPYFRKIRKVTEKMADFYNFGKIDTPILEDAGLFSRGVGDATDIVKKEMFSLKTKGGNLLALRPEWTAPVVRSYLEHGMYNLPQPLKLWYFGPCFRYEHPQAGRYRQFWQFGFEVLGEGSPVIDAQAIQIFYETLKQLGIKDLVVEINSIGDSQCRPYYKKLLSNYFRSKESSLCANCKKRLKENALRILDCDEEKCQPVIASAPQTLDHLCDDCKEHLKRTLEFLDELGIPYSLNPHLVRGLDYYTRTVFEIYSKTPDKEGVSRLALGGGGRYDGLVKLLGGKDTPAAGWAAGVERIVSLMKEQKDLSQKSCPDVFIAQLGDLAKRKALKLLEEFRKSNIKTEETLGRDSLKAQLNRADRMGAKYTLIIGQREALDETALVKDMENGKQQIVKMDKLSEKLKKELKKKR